VRAQYAEQLGWAVEEGIDFVISETNDYLGEALIALEVIQELGLPAMVTLASTQPETTRDGYDYVEACRILADHGATIVGLNCDRGPDDHAAAAGADPGGRGLRVAVPAGAPYRTDTASPTMHDPAIAERGAGLPGGASDCVWFVRVF
jgi:betaine-homocysteine S-methyltransferase